MDDTRNPFGRLLDVHLVTGGLHKDELAAGINLSASSISKMCLGEIRPQGMHRRERILTIIGWLYQERALANVKEGDELLHAAGHVVGMDEKEVQEAFPTPEHLGDSISFNLQTPRIITGLPDADTPATVTEEGNVVMDVAKVLAALTSDIYLDLDKGWLQRTRVRQVLLRVETIRLLISKLSGEDLQEAGSRIGASAAADLIQNTLNRAAANMNMTPADYRFLIALWSYWESTGGMGKLSLQEPGSNMQDKKRRPQQGQDGKSKEEQGEEAAHQEAKSLEWHIRIENNFLAAEDPKERSRLNMFWCGYIQGFLNEAFPHLGDLIGQSQSPIEVTGLHLVSEVSVEEDDANNPLFRVTFAKQSKI
ncbi:MAG TPA: hypothetical protein VF826_05400 [Chloroflexia bacterium]|jgi:hypothetical protein